MDHRFKLASCLGERSSTGARGQWIGSLAGTTIVDHALAADQLEPILQGRVQSGTMFSLSSTSAAMNHTMIPLQPVQASIIGQTIHTTACSIPSPNSVVFQGVPKSASITAMAWIQLADAPRHKEACILSHGTYEKGWKLSMSVSSSAAAASAVAAPTAAAASAAAKHFSVGCTCLLTYCELCLCCMQHSTIEPAIHRSDFQWRSQGLFQ